MKETKTDQAPQDALGKRLKATDIVAKSGKKKQPTQGLETLSEIAMSEAEQMKVVTKRSKKDFHSSHASGSGANEGTGVILGVFDVPIYTSEDKQISWKSSDEEDDDEVSMSKDDDDNADDEDDDDDERTESYNNGDDFIHPKFTTHDKEERQDEDDKEEEGSDLRVQTPSHYESTDDDVNDVVSQGGNAKREEQDEEEINEEEEVNELYMDVNVNLERRDTEMTDANVQATQVIEDTHVIITAVTPEVQQQSSSVSLGFISNMLNPNPDTGIDSILNLNTESTSLVDVPVTTNAEMPPPSITTLPPPPIPLIHPLQQTPVPTPIIVQSTSLQNLPTFGSLFKFEDRVKSLEDNFSEFKQTNPFAEAVSSIPGIIDKYIANQMNEAVKVAVQLQSDRLREEAQAENEDFINKIDENMKKIIKEQVKVQVKEQVSKILPRIKKSVNEQLEAEVLTLQQEALYKALVDAYETDKDILETYGDTLTFKRRRDDEDEDEEPSAGSNRGSKRRRDGKEPESTSAPKEKTSKSSGKSKEGSKSCQAEKPTHTVEDLKISNLAQKEDSCESFNELMDTPLDFSAFVLNQLKVDTLTPEVLAGPTFELMKGSCKSLVELEYFLEEVCKATTDQLDWNNPEGQQYLHDMRKPLPLIPNLRGRRVIPFDHFINNDLAYLSGGVSSRTYATLVTKTKAADYGHIKWIEDLVPNTMWSQVSIVYDKHALWGISHWGRKPSTIHDITVRRNDDKLYTFKEGDYNRLRLQDIEDMLLLLIQGKLTNLNIEERLALGVSLRMFTRSIVLKRRVEDLQLGVESYQKKLNLTRLDTASTNLETALLVYTAYSNPRGFIYQTKDKKNILMRIDELYKFSNGTLNDVQSALDDILKRIRMEYLPQTVWRSVDRERAGAMIQAIDQQLRNKRLMRSVEKFIGGRPYMGYLRLLERTIL
ncbi:hypothetical protein Tco_0503043 [Tanacetum coccineum]